MQINRERKTVITALQEIHRSLRAQWILKKRAEKRMCWPGVEGEDVAWAGVEEEGVLVGCGGRGCGLGGCGCWRERARVLGRVW
jgi:hypothetical protein